MLKLNHKLYSLNLKVPKSIDNGKITAHFSNEKRMLEVKVLFSQEEKPRPNTGGENEELTAVLDFGNKITIESEKLYDIF